MADEEFSEEIGRTFSEGIYSVQGLLQTSVSSGRAKSAPFILHNFSDADLPMDL